MKNLYYPADISDAELTLIQQELTDLYAKKEKLDFSKTSTSFTSVVDKNLIISSCPTLSNILRNFGLHEQFLGIAFITAQEKSDFPIHSDGNPYTEIYALNIPVLNCDQSYTVWYDVAIHNQPISPELAVMDETAVYARYCDQDRSQEIGRCDANIPHWIDVMTPHSVEIEHNKFRINSSMRFLPGWLENGELPSRLIKK